MAPSAPHRNHHFDEPLTIPPRGPHTHTLILLHGRGDKALNFGPQLITTELVFGPKKTLAARFPGVKFVFPTAKVSQAWGWFGGINQWFDIGDGSMVGKEEEEEFMRDGLTNSVRFVHELIDYEAEKVGIGNVVIGGLSQGAATSLYALLTYDDGGKGALGGVICLSGRLPFQQKLWRLADDSPETAETEPRDGKATESITATSDSYACEASSSTVLAVKATKYARSHLTPMPPIPEGRVPGAIKTPIFQAHGAEDRTVPCALGQAAADTMKRLGWDITWMLYDDLEHWYYPDELEDMANWFSTKVGIPELLDKPQS